MRAAVVLLVLAVLAPARTLRGACVPGTAVGCDDGNPCTSDSCGLLGCTHTPLTGPSCDDGDPCTQNDQCQNGSCVGTPVTCPDDGFACTDDVCTQQGCVHVPVDSRCTPAADCVSAVCDPARPDRDAAGCASEGCTQHGGPCPVPGSAIGCDDHDPCTADSCEAGGCVHTPISGPSCDDGDACTENDRCQAGSCVGTPVTCPDDGFACTDDVCLGGGCVHVPVDSRCVPPGGCTDAVCAPERAEHDAAGCVAGPPRADGEECAEDGNACTLDHCSNGSCRHDEDLDPASCTPVQSAFRQALALGILARQLIAEVDTSALPSVLARLERIDEELGATARALAGKTDDGAAPGPTTPLAETPLLKRARLALDLVRRMRPQVSGLLRALGLRHVRAQFGVEVARDIGRHARLLLHGTRALHAELRRLRRVTASFARGGA